MTSTGLQLIKTRINVKEICIINEIELPILYKSFLRSFELGKNGLNIDFVKLSSELIQISCVVYKTTINGSFYENSIDNFLSLHDLQSEINSYSKKEQPYHSQGYIRIGNFDVLDQILLKIEGEYKDQISKFNGDWGYSMPPIEKLADSIFEFTESISKDIIHLNLSIRNIKIQDLKKGFDDPYWTL